MKWIMSIICMSTLILACQETKETKNEVSQETAQAVEEIKQASKKAWANLQDEWESVDGQIATELENLEDEIEKATGDAKLDLIDRQSKLKQWQDELGDRFESGWEKVQDDWEESEAELQKKMNEIKESLSK